MILFVFIVTISPLKSSAFVVAKMSHCSKACSYYVGCGGDKMSYGLVTEQFI